MSENSQNSHNGLKTFGILVLVILVGAFWYFTLFENPENIFGNDIVEKNGSYKTKLTDSANISYFNLEILAEVANFEVNYLPSTSENLIEIDWEYRYAVSSHNQDDPVQIYFSNSSSNDSLNFLINVGYESTLNFNNIRNIEFDVLIHPNFSSYGFKTDLTVGSLHFNAIDTKIHQFVLETTTGYQNVHLDNITFTNNLSIVTTTGGVDVIFENLYFTEESNILIDTTTGGGDFYWMQSQELGANVLLDIEGTTGGYEIEFQIPESLVRYDLFWDAEIGDGDLSFTPEFTTIDSHNFQSPNYSDETKDLITINIQTSVGGIDLMVNAND